MKNRKALWLLVVLGIMVGAVALCGCSKKEKEDDEIGLEVVEDGDDVDGEDDVYFDLEDFEEDEEDNKSNSNKNNKNDKDDDKKDEDNNSSSNSGSESNGGNNNSQGDGESFGRFF